MKMAAAAAGSWRLRWGKGRPTGWLPPCPSGRLLPSPRRVLAGWPRAAMPAGARCRLHCVHGLAWEVTHHRGAVCRVPLTHSSGCSVETA